MTPSDTKLIEALHERARTSVDVVALFELIADAHSPGTDEIPRLLLAKYFHLAFGGKVEHLKSLKRLTHRIERIGGRITSTEPEAEKVLNEWITETRSTWDDSDRSID